MQRQLFSNIILLKLYPIVNVFLFYFQTITKQLTCKQRGWNNVSLTLSQRRHVETTVNFNLLLLQGICLNASTSLFMNTGYPTVTFRNQMRVKSEHFFTELAN